VCTHVAPGIEAIKEGELEKGERVNSLVEEGGESRVRYRSVFICRGTGKVEVSKEDPGARDQRCKIGQLKEK